MILGWWKTKKKKQNIRIINHRIPFASSQVHASATLTAGDTAPGDVWSFDVGLDVDDMGGQNQEWEIKPYHIAIIVF